MQKLKQADIKKETWYGESLQIQTNDCTTTYITRQETQADRKKKVSPQEKIPEVFSLQNDCNH